MNFPIRSLLVLACSVTVWLAPVSAVEDLRLSQTLLPDERVASGIVTLTSDQVAILDALVRRDIANSRGTAPRAALFSDRLTADERRNAGLTQLTANQLSRLDSYVARLLVPIPNFSAGDGPVRNSAWTAKSLKRAPEIHGMISLMYGVGSDGYSERGGSMVLSYDDPSGISLLVGYSEVRTKGGNFYRDYYEQNRYGSYGRSPFYDFDRYERGSFGIMTRP